jgi:hypothetical protein
VTEAFSYAEGSTENAGGASSRLLKKACFEKLTLKIIGVFA